MAIRTKLRIAFGIFSVPFLVVLYFNIENLASRLGWANILADAIAPERGSSPVVEFLQHPATLWTALIGVGISIGLWVDATMAKRERIPLEEEAQKHFIDREKLAGEAEELARNIAELAAQGEARRMIAWNEEAAAMMNEEREAKRVNFGQDKSARERAATIEKYGEKYHADAWRVIDSASRLIPLSRNQIRGVEHVLTSVHDIESMARFLMFVANSLRYPNEPPVPLEGSRAMPRPEPAPLQWPQDTGSRTQP